MLRLKTLFRIEWFDIMLLFIDTATIFDDEHYTIQATFICCFALLGALTLFQPVVSFFFFSFDFRINTRCRRGRRRLIKDAERISTVVIVAVATAAAADDDFFLLFWLSFFSSFLSFRLHKHTRCTNFTKRFPVIRKITSTVHWKEEKPERERKKRKTEKHFGILKSKLYCVSFRFVFPFELDLEFL